MQLGMYTIQYLELFAFYWSLSEHVGTLKDRHVPVRGDNSNAVQWLHKMTVPLPYMPLMRQIQTIIFEKYLGMSSTVSDKKRHNAGDFLLCRLLGLFMVNGPGILILDPGILTNLEIVKIPR